MNDITATLKEDDAEAFWAHLEQRDADRWEGIKATMLAAGFDVTQGACLYVPTSYFVGKLPDWAFLTHAPIVAPVMCQSRPGTPIDINSSAMLQPPRTSL